jgi:uncharacterized protein (TIGR02246 family)
MAAPMTAEDRLGVFDLIASYAYTLEAGDLDGYVDNFTPDGVWEGGSGRHVGRTAIRTFVERLIQIGQDGPEGHRHFLGIPHITGDSEHCRAQTYVIIPAEGSRDTVNVGSFGVYRDEIVKHDGRWRFAHRHLQGITRRELPNPLPKS